LGHPLGLLLGARAPPGALDARLLQLQIEALRRHHIEVDASDDTARRGVCVLQALLEAKVNYWFHQLETRFLSITT